ncbi:Nuclear pore complex protein NUP214 [Striga hermonthica]|uniref:Nuclear pore complex protein NUP214 n=1 Tax=Striga hermonthica TaxID=68872 RepID=A0A9N7RG11_STRHE|nr:Nuclear pore complex protein NUP214 [Striga hermonthica]
MSTLPAADGAAVEVDEEIEGEEIGSRNYRFSKIGESVSINSEFDTNSLPSQPLAVSERLRLLFVAYPKGFYVARTKDVIATAEESKEKQKGQSLQELSLVDVPIEKVSILALSADDSLLAASVDSYVHFFAVSALLHKEKKPSYSVTLDESSCVKDFRWAKKVAKAYLILSANGKLYHGTGQGPLGYVMEGVDSVDWSVKGNFVAVAKKNAISILSPQFKEKVIFSLPFRSVVGESDVNQVIKVDSIRWIRPDCLAVGCFQLDDDGAEENYIVQVITSRDGRLTDEASKPTVLSFSNIFMDFCSDAVPTRNGSHLLLSYLDHCGLAFIANRNLSRTVGLFCWLPDKGKNKAAVVEILNDAWNLYIDSQEDGEENVILGLSVDKVSQNEEVKFMLGDEETEVSPCCVIIYLTIDGKISVFHFASAAGALTSPESCASDEENEASQIFAKQELPLHSSTGGEESKNPTLLTSGSHKFSEFGMEKIGAKVTVTSDLSPSINGDIKSREHPSTENMGQKTLVYSQTPKLAEPVKAFPLILNQDSKVENQSTSEVKHNTSSFSGEVTGDLSCQSITKDSQSSGNVDPSQKAPTPHSLSSWSLTRSTASKTADGRFSLFPSDVGNPDKHALQSAGSVLRHPTDINEISKPTVSYPSFGQTASIAQGHRIVLSANPVSEASPGEGAVSGKHSQPEFRKEVNSSSSRTGLQYSIQNASKQSGNVEEMAKKLDILLEGIEGKGGFLDASITSQTKSVTELEDNIWTLSSKCRKWRGYMNEQLKELKLLLEKTVQVSVRKVYMEGVFKQATDSRYLELWNHQKLSSELELKQRRISDLNQELTNKLIELERHFNSLELNKFGNDGMQRNRRGLQNWHGHSRQTQSLNTLHNTMQAQLAAAEQLSECLSNQMAALSIESFEKQDVKKKLFESIGLSYIGDSERSPARDRISCTPLNKEQLLTSRSVTYKDHTGRNQSTFVKTPETARRRRDSLDRSWASFEPRKTTVKRVLKEYGQSNTNLPLLNIDKQSLSPQLPRKSEVAHSANSSMYRAALNSYKNKGVAEIPEQHTVGQCKPVLQRTTDSPDNGNQNISTRNSLSLPPPSMLETRTAENSGQVAFQLIGEKSRGGLPLTGNKDTFAASEFNFSSKDSDTRFQALPSTSTLLTEQSLTSSSVSPDALEHFKHGFTTVSKGEQKKNAWTGSNTPLFDSKIPVRPASAFSSGTNLIEKVPPFTTSSEKPSQPNDSLTDSVPSQSLLGSSLFSSNSVPSLASSVSKPSSSTSTSVAKQEADLQPQMSVSSTLNFQSNLLSSSPSSSITKSDTQTSLFQPPVPVLGSNTENLPSTKTPVNNTLLRNDHDVKIQASPLQSGFSVFTSGSELTPFTSSGLTELPSNSKLGSQIDSGVLSKSSAVTSLINAEPPTAAEVRSPASPSSEGIIGSAKTVGLISSEEEEMEEEAPDTDQTTELSLGNLGGFGIGSMPNSTTPKSNPFGVSTLNKDATHFASSLNTSAPIGELFKPASFQFQQPLPLMSSQPTAVNFSGGFSSGNSGQVSAVSGFGQPANMGAGQQALGSVLGSFGQSRQLGPSLPGSNVAPASGFGGIPTGGFGGFGSASTAGGFASLATGGGGFAAAATAAGGFAAAATAAGGFAAAATAAGGFGAAASNPGGGFGAFGNQQGGGAFAAFGGGSGAGRPPSDLFTQMRK